MVEAYLRQSALAHLHLAAAGAGEAEGAAVALSERPHRGQIDLRGRGRAFGEAVKGVLGFALPGRVNTAAGNRDLAKGPRALWLGPDEWLVVTAPGGEAALAGALAKAVAETPAAVTDVGEGRTVIGLSGAEARPVLMKGCSLDLHPRAFAAGRCAQTRLAKASVILHQTSDAPAYDIYVHRSFAEYLWAWLTDAAREYGYRIGGG